METAGNAPRGSREEPVGVVEVVAGAVLVALLLAAGVREVVGKPGTLRLISIAGVLLLALLAVHRGDATLLTSVTGLVLP
jgi:hypothetical protein